VKSDISKRATIVTPAVEHVVSKWKRVLGTTSHLLFTLQTVFTFGVIIVIAAWNVKLFNFCAVRMSPIGNGWSSNSSRSNNEKSNMWRQMAKTCNTHYLKVY